MKNQGKRVSVTKNAGNMIDRASIIAEGDRGILVFLILLSLLTFYITPWIIPPDGSLYLSSARSIFTADMFSYYHWMREPLYPIFLKILLFSNNLYIVMLIQSFLIGISVFLIYKSFAFFLIFASWQKYSAALISFIFIRGFGTAILMQALLLFIVALATYINSRIVFHEQYKMQFSNTLVFSGGLVCLLAFSLQILVGISVLIVFIYVLTKAKTSSKKSFIGALCTILICVISIGLWQSLKNAAIENGELVFGSNSLTEYRFFESTDPLQRQEQRIQAFTGTLGLAPERDAYITRPVGIALREWAMPFFNNEVWNQNGQCGQYDRSHSASILTYIAPLTKVKYCHNAGQITLSNFLSATGVAIYPVFSLLIIAYIVFLVFTFDLRLISLLGVSTIMLFEYSAVGQGHSRFGAPLFMISPFLFIFILNKGKYMFERVWN